MLADAAALADALADPEAATAVTAEDATAAAAADRLARTPRGRAARWLPSFEVVVRRAWRDASETTVLFAVRWD